VSKIYIGIDPGVTGAVAIIDPINGLEVHDMPVHVVPNGKRKESQVDATALFELLQNTLFGSRDAVLILEKTQPMQDSAMTAFSMGMSRMAVIAVAGILEIPRIDVTPQEWKKHFVLLKCDKEASRSLALQRFPALRENLKNKNHHNRAEALLIALWGKEKGW